MSGENEAFICSECGNDYVLNEDETTNHLVEGSNGVSDIDYDMDEDHCAF